MALWLLVLTVGAYGELIGLAQLSRHGLRTPIGRPQWAYPESSAPGSLTPDGEAQQSAHGRALRLNYSSFLGDFYDPRLVYTRATAYNRTIASVTAQLKAMYPDDSQFEIKTAGKQEDIILLPHLACPMITRIMDSRMVETETHGKMTRKINDLKYEVTRWAGGVDFLTVFDASEVIVNYLDRGIEPKCSHAMVDLLKTVYNHGNTYLLYGDSEQRKLGASLFLGEITSRFQTLLSGGAAPVLSLYAGHDISLIPVLLTLGIDEIPGIGAFLTFELHTENSQAFIRVKYNGEDRNLTVCASPCTFPSFVSALEQKTYTKVSDWVAQCNHTDTTIGRNYIVLMVAGGAVIVGAVWKRWREISHGRVKKE